MMEGIAGSAGSPANCATLICNRRFTGSAGFAPCFRYRCTRPVLIQPWHLSSPRGSLQLCLGTGQDPAARRQQRALQSRAGGRRGGRARLERRVSLAHRAADAPRALLDRGALSHGPRSPLGEARRHAGGPTGDPLPRPAAMAPRGEGYSRLPLARPSDARPGSDRPRPVLALLAARQNPRC